MQVDVRENPEEDPATTRISQEPHALIAREPQMLVTYLLEGVQISIYRELYDEIVRCSKMEARRLSDGERTILRAGVTVEEGEGLLLKAENGEPREQSGST